MSFLIFPAPFPAQLNGDRFRPSQGSGAYRVVIGPFPISIEPITGSEVFTSEET